MQITELFSSSIKEGKTPHDIVMFLIQQQVDQNLIGQALLTLGYEEQEIIKLFEEIQTIQQPQNPTDQQITNNPQQLARAEEIEQEAPNMDMNITSINQAKSGIEIKPENNGKFTRWAQARGMSVLEAANTVMNNIDSYPPSVVKMANFAKNAAGWNKQNGGENIPSYTEEVRQKEGSYNQPNRNYTLDSRFRQEGGESEKFEPHFMYKGPRKIRAKDMATHLRLKERGYTHELLKAQNGIPTSSFVADVNKSNQNSDKLVRGINKLEDEGILSSGPMYINPAIFNNNKFNLGKAANVVLEGYENMFSRGDENKDGIKDGSFKDVSEKFKKAKLDKYANATYNVKLDTSDENKNAVKDWFTQFQIENPTIEKTVDNLRNGGSLYKAEPGKEVPKKTLTFKEWVMEDPVTRSTGSAQQDYQTYVAGETAEASVNEGFEFSQPTANDLFQKIKQPEVDINTGGVGGFLDRAINNPIATAYGDISNFAVKGANVFNDYFDQVNKDKAQKELRGSLVADNIYGTKTNAFNKRGTFDINSGIMGSEGDATTGLYMNAKFGGGINNAGFKALPAEAQHNILSNMAYGGAKKLNEKIVNVNSKILAKLIAAGANIEIL